MKRIFFVLALALMVALCAVSAAEGRAVTLVLGQDTPTNGNKAYKKDGRAYDRDLTAPVLNGMQALKGSQTGSAVP